MTMPKEPEIIGLVVEADNELHAKVDAATMMRSVGLHYYAQTWHFKEAWPLDGDTGRAAINRIWVEAQLDYLADLIVLRKGFSGRGTPGWLIKNLDDLAFRAACYRLGAYEGPPVRLYDQMATGIIMPGNLANILDKPAGLWIVLVEMKGGDNA